MSATAVIPTPADRLDAAIRRCGAPVCVGLDPVFAKIPSEVRDGARDEVAAIERFSLEVLDAVDGAVPAVKPQAACFERYGPTGYAALARVIGAARGRFEVILDWKRGDIGISSEHYAAGAVALGADWVTANAYLGLDGVRPFLEAGLGVFALVRTSNPESDAIQSPPLADGRSVSQAVAELVADEGARWMGAGGSSSLGAVVGATKKAEIAQLRAIMSQQIFLVPGYGAQGAGAAETAACFRAGGRGAIVSASRSVLYPAAGAGRWADAVRAEAKRFACEIAGVARQ